MGTILGSEVMADARRLLQDESNISQRWGDPLLLKLLNEGQLAAVGVKHDVFTRLIPYELTPGTLQPLPDGAVAFLRLTRNLGLDGLTTGRVIETVELEDMDHADPNWQAAEDSETVYHGVYDHRAEKYFYVWPPAPGRYVELMAVMTPPRLASPEETISVDDVYAPALAAYICYGAFAQDMDNEKNREQAQVWYSQFLQLLGLKTQAEMAVKDA